MEPGAPIIVTATFAPGDDGWLQQLRRTHFPPERNLVPAHLTLFHHLPPTLAPELGRRLIALAAHAPPPARIAGLQDLGGGTALRVDSSALEDMRAELVDAFHGLLVPQDRAGWRPHITIQNKVARKDAIFLQKKLADTYTGRPLAIAGLAIWHYRNGPWTAIRRFRFRG